MKIPVMIIEDEMIVAMEAIKQAFSPKLEGPKLLRGIGMSIINNVTPAKKLLIQQAFGQKSNLPALAIKRD